MDSRTRMALWAFYFTNFGALGLFIPYFNLYADSLGFSDTRIGLLLAVMPLAKAALPAAWGSAADRLGARRALLVISAWAAAAAFSGFLMASSYEACLAIMIAYAALAVPALPFVEATTLEVIAVTGADYGRIRVAGSVGFALAALLFGWFTGGARPFLVVPAMLGVLLANAAAATLVPVAPRSSPAPAARLKALLGRRPIALLLATGFLMQASHGAYVGFFSLVLGEAGYGRPALGMAWAGSIVAEVVMMLGVGTLLAAIGSRRLLAVSVAAAGVRWGVYALTLAPVAVVAGQALHAFTYAGFHVAAVQRIQRLFPPGSRSTGQALYSGWTYGAGMMAGTAVSGILKDHLGREGMFAFAAALAAAALLLIVAGGGRDAGVASGRTG